MDSQNGGWSALLPEDFYAHSMVPDGEGVFETLKIVDSQACWLSRHVARLSRSAVQLGLEPPNPSRIQREVEDHLRARPLALGRMRLIWSASHEAPRLSIASAPTSPAAPAVTLTRSDWRVDELSPLVGLKTTDYVDYWVALRAAQKAGFDEALLVNTEGHVCEATTANLFYVVDGVLCTPTLAAGCLPGIARELVTELCTVAELDAAVSVLDGASEVFLTSSLREVQPVSRLDGRTYQTPGPITTEVMAAWRRASESTAIDGAESSPR